MPESRVHPGTIIRLVSDFPADFQQLLCDLCSVHLQWQLGKTVKVDPQRDLSLYRHEMLEALGGWSQLDGQIVQGYAERMDQGDAFPPLIVYGDDVLWDGYHRWLAMRVRGVTHGPVIDLAQQHTAHQPPSSPGIEHAAQPEPSRFQPRVMATAHSDDRAIEIEPFDVTPFLVTATDETLQALHDCGWGADSAADEVAIAYGNSQTRPVFQYIDLVNGRDDRCHLGFECRVDRQQVMDWLQIHRPKLWAEFAEEDNE